MDEGTPQGFPLSPFLSNIVSTISTRNWLDVVTGSAVTRMTATSMFAATTPAKGEGLDKPVPDRQAPLESQRGKSAVARPEERKFLGFSIANDGSERRIAPKALDKFKDRIREITCRTRGISLQQMIADLRPYLIGWRGYFGFGQTPRVLTNLEAWIRRRLRLYLWRTGGRA